MNYQPRPRYLPPSEVARLLGLHRNTIRAMCERGEFLNALKIPNAGWRVPDCDIEAFIEAHKVRRDPQ